jgi:hypothetical protein
MWKAYILEQFQPTKSIIRATTQEKEIPILRNVNKIFKIFKHSHKMPRFHAFQYGNNTHFSCCHHTQIFAPFSTAASYAIIIIIFFVHCLRFALHQNPKLLISNLLYKHPKSFKICL